MQNYTIVKRPTMMVIGISCRTSNQPDAAPHDIPQLWAKFIHEDVYKHIPNKASQEVFGVYYQYEKDYTKPYSFMAGCHTHSLDEIPEGMTATIIPASSYAVFSVSGDFPQSLINTWRTIWATDLKRTYQADFELYDERFNQGSPKEMDVYIGIKG